MQYGEVWKEIKGLDYSQWVRNIPSQCHIPQEEMLFD